jgi:hypothetical protein
VGYGGGRENYLGQTNIISTFLILVDQSSAAASLDVSVKAKGILNFTSPQ